MDSSRIRKVYVAVDVNGDFVNRPEAKTNLADGIAYLEDLATRITPEALPLSLVEVYEIVPE